MRAASAPYWKLSPTSVAFSRLNVQGVLTVRLMAGSQVHVILHCLDLIIHQSQVQAWFKGKQKASEKRLKVNRIDVSI